MFELKFFSVVFILVLTLLSGYYPFHRKRVQLKSNAFASGEALAAGVFLGAGLIHMLGDSTQAFIHEGYQYPFACLLAGSAFIVLLFLEHIGREIYHSDVCHHIHDHHEVVPHHGPSAGFAILSVVMLSIHSFLEGAAVGVSQSYSFAIVIVLAILAHKWAESFALSMHINKSTLSLKLGALFFLVFALMTPLGISLGALASSVVSAHPLWTPTLSALAAGTFLYLGTLHGLNRAVMIEKCCNLRQFVFMVAGFFLMAVVAIWT